MTKTNRRTKTATMRMKTATMRMKTARKGTKRMVMANAGPCNRPDLIARVFEAKSGNKRHAGCFGNECKMNGFCFFAVFRIVFS
ncbi:BQ5605_C011g06431 [Microbotryum silenes-dioicae]|uniref:BQ5605_C011g06431 protein n=1 Tax=Microbotryum silenes-dioicae TaxID=796604 RepID=A0A2X0LSE8_9BASI|nr:BQ5605_C011g06431 [Microbotryum silenes-dioicae]